MVPRYDGFYNPGFGDNTNIYTSTIVSENRRVFYNYPGPKNRDNEDDIKDEGILKN